MSYDPKAVANYFIERAKEDGVPVSPLKLQKLVFFAHGWNLALINAPLIRESVQAWKFGPVVPSLYHEFKDFGNDPIRIKATTFSFDNDTIRTETPEVPDSDDTTKRLLSKVWDVYGGVRAIDLSNLTHAPNSPWAKAVESFHGEPPPSVKISDDTIKEHFVAQGRRNKQK
jgi:uncharacterized phage-associated protein